MTRIIDNTPYTVEHPNEANIVNLDDEAYIELVTDMTMLPTLLKSYNGLRELADSVYMTQNELVNELTKETE